VGHSAGGWLGRALMAREGDAWAKRHVLVIATLGAPHRAPPPVTMGGCVGVDRGGGVCALPGCVRLFEPTPFYHDFDAD
jgi:hypothetical protein